MTDERPIEEALTLLRERPGLAENVQRIILDLVDAVQAGEKAHAPHTPTDDEREALLAIFAEPVIASTDEEVREAFADMVLAAGFRRSEVPEPSAGLIATLRAWIDGEPFEVSQERTGQPVAKVPFAQQQGYFNGYAAAVDHVAAILAAVPEPLGEPSDAQALEGLVTRAQRIVDSMKSSAGRRTRGDEWCYVRFGQVESLDVVLAALRAASEVGGEGR